MSREPEQDRLLDHQYDGIQEYDNPMPRWWLFGLYGTIVWAALYLLNVIPGIGSGDGREAAYQREMTAAEQKYGAGGPQAAGPDSATVMAAMHDPAKLALGKETFVSTCAACHLEDGGGLIGPNLTDAYWIHGGSPMQVTHTVMNGVLDKGMPAWGAVLKPEQVTAVVAYVMSLEGTKPAQPKAPQGVTADGTAAETPAPAQ